MDSKINVNDELIIMLKDILNFMMNSEEKFTEEIGNNYIHDKIKVNFDVFDTDEFYSGIFKLYKEIRINPIDTDLLINNLIKQTCIFF